jgi:ADP-heptose:LPS heptosyltransferase
MECAIAQCGIAGALATAKRMVVTLKRVLAISFTALGDGLLSLPALDALREAALTATIAFLVPSAFGSLYEGYRGVDQVLSAAVPGGRTWQDVRRTYDLLTVLRRFSPDTAIIFVGSPSYLPALLRLCGTRRVIRVPNRGRFRRLLSNSGLISENDWDTQEHGIEDRLRAVRLLGAEAQLRPMHLPIQDSWILESRRWLAKMGWQDERVVVLQVLANSPRRIWPKDRFIALALKLLAEYPDLRVVITGSPAEKGYCEALKSDSGDSRIWVSAGEIRLPALAALLSQAALVVTPDTGTMHLAHAVGAPTVCLYALSESHRTCALDKSVPHIVIQRLPPGFPNHSEFDRKHCMNYISLDDVLEACLEVISGDGKALQSASR